MSSLPLPLQPRFITLTFAVMATVAFAAAWAAMPYSIWLVIGFAVAAFLTLVGIHDLIQTRHAILRNYPIAAHLRFIFEEVRPELRQYFFEGDKDGTPFSRDRRAIVYQRAKMVLDVRPFGTQYDVYATGYEWMSHSIAPRPVSKEPFRIMIGDTECSKPYSASVFNISAMSFGALSANAIRALNGGARLGGFAHDTGEGGYSPYHREMGGDIIWEIGSGYFGCRNPDGTFNADKFAEGAANPQVKMVELKMSQGAKPGHGGVLPGPKVSKEISLTRGVPMGANSPYQVATSKPGRVSAMAGTSASILTRVLLVTPRPRSLPERINPTSARAPNTKAKASISRDLPAPVSPVRTVKPASNSNDMDSTMTKSRMANERNTLSPAPRHQSLTPHALNPDSSSTSPATCGSSCGQWGGAG